MGDKSLQYRDKNEDETSYNVFSLADLEDVEIELEDDNGTCKVDKVYHCKYCDFETSIYAELTSHKESVIHEEVDQRTCTICWKSIGIASFRTHMRQVHTDFRVSCKVCRKEMKNKQTLRNHMLIKHEENTLGKLYKCKDCDFSSYTFRKFKYHTQIHRKVGTSMCTICGLPVRKDNYNKHIAYHHQSPPISCEICGKMLKNSIILKGHMLTHENNQFQCSLCGKVYKYRQGYAAHMKRHAAGDTKTVKCPICDKRFFDKKVLPKHIRSHTGERPYPCPFCSKGFSSSYALKSHIRQHTNERPFSCDHCDKTFVHKVSLNNHLQSKHLDLIEQQENS